MCCWPPHEPHMHVMFSGQAGLECKHSQMLGRLCTTPNSVRVFLDLAFGLTRWVRTCRASQGWGRVRVGESKTQTTVTTPHIFESTDHKSLKKPPHNSVLVPSSNHPGGPKVSPTGRRKGGGPSGSTHMASRKYGTISDLFFAACHRCPRRWDIGNSGTAQGSGALVEELRAQVPSWRPSSHRQQAAQESCPSSIHRLKVAWSRCRLRATWRDLNGWPETQQ